MSVSKWAYTPERCDGDYCCGECDLCRKPDIDVFPPPEDEEEHKELCRQTRIFLEYAKETHITDPAIK